MYNAWKWQILTVDIYIPADVGVPQCIGDLTGNGLSEERVIHKNLIGVAWHIWDHIASFGPSEMIR